MVQDGSLRIAVKHLLTSIDIGRLAPYQFVPSNEGSARHFLPSQQSHGDFSWAGYLDRFRREASVQTEFPYEVLVQPSRPT